MRVSCGPIGKLGNAKVVGLNRVRLPLPAAFPCLKAKDVKVDTDTSCDCGAPVQGTPGKILENDPDPCANLCPDSQEAGAVLQYTVGATGALTPKSPATVAAGTFPLGIAVSCDGRSVYAANAGDATVSQYSVGATGTLSPRSPAAVAAGTNPLEIAVTPTARIPVSKDQCKNGGWRNFPDFKNQGDCVSYVATGGENQPSGH
jgi:hypothetical protein